MWNNFGCKLLEIKTLYNVVTTEMVSVFTTADSLSQFTTLEEALDKGTRLVLPCTFTFITPALSNSFTLLLIFSNISCLVCIFMVFFMWIHADHVIVLVFNFITIFIISCAFFISGSCRRWRFWPLRHRLQFLKLPAQPRASSPWLPSLVAEVLSPTKFTRLLKVWIRIYQNLGDKGII